MSFINLSAKMPLQESCEMTEEVNEQFYYKQLYGAINKSCIEGFRTVCRSADIKPLRYNPWTPVAEAAATGQTEMLWDLIHVHGFDVDARFELEPHVDEVYGTEGTRLKETFKFCKGTALTLAIEGRHWASVAFLVSAGASVNTNFYQTFEQFSEHCGNESGIEEESCLSLAIENDAPQRIIQLMADNGLDVDATWGRENDNMLSIAVREQKTALVETLLELGADPNQTLYVPSDNRMHPLYWVIQNYSNSDTFQLLEITKLLMDYGADVDFDMHDNSDHDIYQAALSLGNQSLLCAMGLVGRMVKELTQFRADAGL